MRIGRNRPVPLLCYITDRRALLPQGTGNSATAMVAAAARAGVDWIQIREKDLSARALSALVGNAIAAIASLRGQGAPTRILVNDRLDVAISKQAGGVHLAESSLPVTEAHALRIALRPAQADGEFMIGKSCHSLGDARAAAEAGADYVLFGPVFATPSKASFGSPQGLRALAAVCSAVTIPVLAIGGITFQNAASCREAGAAGIAAIRLFQEHLQDENRIQRLRTELQ